MSIFFKMVQTMSSLILIFLLFIYLATRDKKTIFFYYLLLTHPLIPKAPIRYLDLSIVYSILDLLLPLNITVDNPLKEESTFFKPPFQFNLKTDLEAVNRLDNRPLASSLTPPNLKCFKYLKT
jgi:hypothetical protein